jgi:NAD(P)-dependent dehydrogenase (short-subunit alcohol dehydrogenase family)
MIFIAGASGGIGKALYSYYLQQEKNVFGSYFTSPSKDLTLVDVQNEQDCVNWIGNACKTLPDNENITLLNCTGISHASLFLDTKIDVWINHLNVNILGTRNLLNAILPFMVERKYGRIILFSSIVAQYPTKGVSAYATTKSAMWGLSKAIGCEFTIKNITTNCINLGYSELGMIEKVSEKYHNKIIDLVPTHTLCPIHNIISTIDYLRDTEYITGSSIDLNGGLI